MNSIENILYDFLDAKVQSAEVGSAIENAVVHADTYEELKDGAKWIRVDDLLQSVPTIKGNDVITEMNAFIEIQCVARPEKQTPYERREAKKLASNMAMEICALLRLSENEHLGTTDDEVCGVAEPRKRNEWRNVGTVRHPVSILTLRINPEG